MLRHGVTVSAPIETDGFHSRLLERFDPYESPCVRMHSSHAILIVDRVSSDPSCASHGLG